VVVIALGPSPSLTATKLSFLLHLDRYAAALDLLGSLGPAEQATLTFERAYGLYRLGREAEAKEVIDKAVADGHQLGEGAEFLQAQLVSPYLHRPECSIPCRHVVYEGCSLQTEPRYPFEALLTVDVRLPRRFVQAYRAHDYELATELYASLLPHYPAVRPFSIFSSTDLSLPLT
jgi:hypothetical protein